jgi:hypothetical protein
LATDIIIPNFFRIFKLGKCISVTNFTDFG